MGIYFLCDMCEKPNLAPAKKKLNLVLLILLVFARGRVYIFFICKTCHTFKGQKHVPHQKKDTNVCIV